MANKKLNTKEGFTIIEVVLVLAIAGLIFLMVFVALPALQRSQRDTQRRQDMSRVNNSVVQYQTNNSTKANNLPSPGTFYANDPALGEGEYPDNCSQNSACRFIRDYMNSATANNMNSFKDPDGVFYNLVITENLALEDDGILDTTQIAGLNSHLEQNENNGYTIEGENSFSDYVIYLVPGAQCDGESAVESERRHFAILYRLEGAGVYCLDDQ